MWKWNRREIKSEGKRALRKNYWRIVGVMLLVTVMTTGLNFYSPEADIAGMNSGRLYTNSNANIMNDWYNSLETAAEGTDEAQVLTFLGERYTPKKGVLAQVYNTITADKSVLYGTLNSVNDMVFKDRFGEGVVIMVGVFLSVIFSIFVVNVIQVGHCRFIMENRNYGETKFDRVFFPWRTRKGMRVGLIMLKKSVFLFLWDITIIGGIIKSYSYKMVPYILAENPDMNHRDVFRLSRRMMKGYKWKAFVMDLSYIGWYALNIIVPFGILKWVWITPYMDTVYGEMYYQLRAKAKADGLELAELLGDEYLYPETTDLDDYPVEKNPLYNERGRNWIKIDYHRNYTVTSLILMFFVFSLIGWCWEVSLHLFNDGVFVNRGFFHGPWLPIYGSGGVLILVLLRRFADRPALMFVLTVILCGVVEYSVATFLWETQHTYWWNYSGYFLNIHGRVCAEGLLVFGLGGLAFVYVLAPLFDEIFKRIPKRAAVSVCCILLIAFGADTVYSLISPNTGEGITDYTVEESK